MARPLVSVLMPCFNAESYIAEAIDSVLEQTYQPIEIIAINDGSTDRTGAILNRYRARGVRVINQQNRGQSASANCALAEAKGEFIKFFDADDVMEPKLIERQVDRLGERRDAIAMGEWARFYNDPSEARFHPLPMYRDAEPVEWLTSEWKSGEPMMQCAIWLIPKTLLDRSGGWNEKLSLINDFEFFTRVLLEAQEILYAPDARLYYRSGIAGSLSGRRSDKAIESSWLSVSLATQHLLNAEDSSLTGRSCANIFQEFEYTFYPTRPDLCAMARERIAELGGAEIAPTGPPKFHFLRSLIGWRLARRVQRVMGR